MYCHKLLQQGASAAAVFTKLFAKQGRLVLATWELQINHLKHNYRVPNKGLCQVHCSPEKHETIEKLAAANVVAQYIHDSRIKTVAKRALWIGNDETHYLRRWEKHDINDLVTLVKLTINWIEIEQQSKSYVDEMPDKPAW